MSGWRNFPGIVTTDEINESAMGNRVSKSKKFKKPTGTHNLNFFVKEQRVYGSC